MQPTNLTLEERERWAYAENDQQTLAVIYSAMFSGTGVNRDVRAARAETAARQQELHLAD